MAFFLGNTFNEMSLRLTVDVEYGAVIAIALCEQELENAEKVNFFLSMNEEIEERYPRGYFLNFFKIRFFTRLFGDRYFSGAVNTEVKVTARELVDAMNKTDDLIQEKMQRVIKNNERESLLAFSI